MIFNYILISLHLKINKKFALFCVTYYSNFSNLIGISYYSFFYSLNFLTFYFFVNTEEVNFGLKFRRLSFIGCYIYMLLKSSAFIRNLNILYNNLYQSNINLKIEYSIFAAFIL